MSIYKYKLCENRHLLITFQSKILTNLQGWHLFHGIHLPILIAVLFSATLDQADGLDVVRNLLEIEGDAHPPRAGTAPIRVQYWL